MEVNIGADEKKLVVPHSAILDDMLTETFDEEFGVMDEMMVEGPDLEESPFVYVMVEGVLERRDVELGKMNDEYVEIVSGLEKDELVVITPTYEMFDGMEVSSYDEVE